MREPDAYPRMAMRTLLWTAALLSAMLLGFELLDQLVEDDAPWWTDLLASLALGGVVSYLAGQAFGRYLPTRTPAGLFGGRDADDRASSPEPITPRMFFSRRRDPDPPQS